MADQDRAAELRHRTEFLNAFIKELRADGIHVDVVSDDNGLVQVKPSRPL